MFPSRAATVRYKLPAMVSLTTSELLVGDMQAREESRSADVFSVRSRGHDITHRLWVSGPFCCRRCSF